MGIGEKKIMITKLDKNYNFEFVFFFNHVTEILGIN